MTRIFSAAIVIAAVLVFVLPASDTAREQTLQRAIDLMESKGDLAKAMPLFEDAARSSDRAVAARALLYLGQAQERQGTEKARATYERIVKEFSNQTETVAAAQERLAALGGPHTSGVAKRLLCQECALMEEGGTNVSADGRWVAFINDSSGDFEIAGLSTGQVKLLVAKDSTGRADTPVFSRDGRELAFAWMKDDAVHRQLRVMASDPGAKPHVVLESSPEIGYPAPLGWSADGKSILAMHRKGDLTWQLEWVSAAGGGLKLIKSLQWRVAGDSVGPKLSPDGRYIAYAALAVNPKSYADFSGSTDQHIYVLAADGSSETEVVKTSGVNRSPVWTADGKHLLFISDRSGSPALWSVAIENGKAAGAPSLVSTNLGNGQVKSKTVTRSGSYEYLLEPQDLEQIFITDIDSAGRKTQRGTSESLAGTRAAWSPDGKSLAFKRRHHVNDYSLDQSSYDLVVHSLETGDEKTFPTALGFTGYFQPSWFHDGKAILTDLGGSRPRNPGFYRVDLASGEWKQVPLASTALSPDDRTRYFFNADGIIIATDRATGTQRQIFSTHPTLNRRVRLSPDRRTLAIWYGDLPGPKSHVGTIDVDGGKFREILTLPTTYLSGLDWSKDGQTILFGQKRRDKMQLMRIPVQGGTPEFTGIEAEGWIDDIDISPDGSRIAFSATTHRVSELWALDNVLSALK